MASIASGHDKSPTTTAATTNSDVRQREFAFPEFVDRAIEKLRVVLPPADQGAPEIEQADVFALVRARHNDPHVALELVKLIMTSSDSKVRSLAELALAGTTNTEAKDLLQAEHMIRRFSEGGGKFGTEVKEADALVAALTERREHPLVAARLVEAVTRGGTAGYYAATILQGTPDRAIHDTLKGILTSALDRGYAASAELRDLRYITTALEKSTDPDTQALIIRAFKEGDEAFGTNNFRYSAALALAAINTAEVRALLCESVTTPQQDWTIRQGVAEAIHDLGAAEVNDKLRPLIDGPSSKTAWIIAGERTSSFLGRAVTWVDLMTVNRPEIEDIRVQVGLALRKAHPDLADKVFQDAIKWEQDNSSRGCQFFAACDAKRALSRKATA